MVDESEEKCWIGLQEERGAPIRVCTCHSFGGIDHVGRYLFENFSSWHYEKDGHLVVKELRAIIDMKDVTVGKLSRIMKNVETLTRMNIGRADDEPSMIFDGFEAFYTAFFEAASINYAYLFAVDPKHNTNAFLPSKYDWAAMTKICFNLRQALVGTSARFYRIEI